MVAKCALLALIVIPVAVLVGCSSDTVTPGDPVGGSSRGIAQGEVDPGTSSFDIVIEAADDPSGPIAGPFVLRGTNVHYEDGIGALVCDLRVVNRGKVAHGEPVSLAFVTLLPEGVTVLNPDNEEHGPGAMVVFAFENDDAQWTPGEASLPRTVQFGVKAGQAIGFVARLDVGTNPDGGAIGGVVWNDANQNQMMDTDETGIPGVKIALAAGDVSDRALANVVRITETARDGSYRFDGMRAGFYTVFKVPQRGLAPTTPSVLHVVLTASDGGVSNFLVANFGCVRQIEPPLADIELGDFIMATGDLTRIDDASAGLAIAAKEIIVYRCVGRWETPFPPDEGPCILRPGELRGPVTAIDRDTESIEVMGEWVSFAHMIDDTIPDDTLLVAGPERNWLDHIGVGDRVRVWAFDAPNNVEGRPLRGLGLAPWTARPEQAFGYVKRIGGTTTEPPVDVIILRHTRVMITNETKIVRRVLSL